MAPYGTKNIYLTADVLKYLADVFGATIDFLVKGDNESKAQASLKDTERIYFRRQIYFGGKGNKKIGSWRSD